VGSAHPGRRPLCGRLHGHQFRAHPPVGSSFLGRERDSRLWPPWWSELPGQETPMHTPALEMRSSPSAEPAGRQEPTPTPNSLERRPVGRERWLPAGIFSPSSRCKGNSATKTTRLRRLRFCPDVASRGWAVSPPLLGERVQLHEVGHRHGQAGLEGLVGGDPGEDRLRPVHVAGRVAEGVVLHAHEDVAE
jgi:hypothetical protein